MLPGHLISIYRIHPTQTQRMIDTTSTRPPERKKLIEGSWELAGYDRSDRLHAWGVSVSREMSKVSGRVLDPPRITYHPGSIEASPRVSNGAWNLTRSKFLTPGAPLVSWSVLNLSRMPVSAVKDFVTSFVRVCRSRGAYLADPLAPIPD